MKVESLSPAEQRRRLEKLSRELGTDNGETLDMLFEKMVLPKVQRGKEAYWTPVSAAVFVFRK